MKFLKSKFESFWIKEINTVKLGADGLDHNKLRLYKNIKGSFKIEPYLELVNNRNQRCNLTRMRISAHHLHIETGHYNRPSPTPIANRICKYCTAQAVDNESHFLLHCESFANKRSCFFNKLNKILPNFMNLHDQSKLACILCPATAIAAKLSNKYISILFSNRKRLDEGIPINVLTFPPQVEDYLDSLSNLSITDNDSSFSSNDTSFNSNNCSFSSN